MVLEISTCKSIHSEELLLTNHHHLPPLCLIQKPARIPVHILPSKSFVIACGPQPHRALVGHLPSYAAPRPWFLIDWYSIHFWLASLSELKTLEDSSTIFLVPKIVKFMMCKTFHFKCIKHTISYPFSCLVWHACVVHWKQVASCFFSSIEWV